jgi:hypothetical protein
MKNKNERKKFTIQFNQDNPLHIEVVDILNGLNPRGKARFIADAILHYVNCDKAAEVNHPNQSIETKIETVVMRIIQEMGVNGKIALQASAPATKDDSSMRITLDSSSVINFDDIDYEESMEVLSGDGFNAIADTLKAFRRM